MTKSDSVTAPLAKNDYMTSDDESNPMHPSANNNIASLSTSYPDRPSAANSIDSTSTTGNWQRDLASDWDYCLVFPAEKGELGQRQRGYIFTLRKLGFELFLYKNINANHEIYVLLRVPLEKLRAFADNIDYVMLLDSKEIEQQLSTGDPEAKIEPVEIAHMPEVVKYHPYEKIYGKYSRNINEILYYKEAHMEHPFREIVRMKLISMILESRPPGGGQNLKIRRYIRSGWLKACFPLHNRQKTETLETKWKLYPYQKLPLNDLKEYFGEKVTLYFGFVEHYTQFLMFPAIIGLPFQLAVFITEDFSAPFLPAYSFVVALWSVTMLEFWKRKEKTYALDWGTIDFESYERDRPDFRGDHIKSFVDGSEIRYFPSKRRNNILTRSFMAVGGLIMLVAGIVVSIYVLRYAIAGDVGDSNAQTVASIANAVQIQVVNYIYSFLANALTEWENHRTDTQFEDSMISKIFLFQFVNSYASFFYLAFVAKYLEGGCGVSDCMESLAVNLGIIYGSRLITGNLLELLLPYLTFQFKYRTKILIHGGKISRPEKEFLLDPYDMISSSLEDYAEIAIQYGYMALFVSALPIAAFFALISNIVEIKGDGWKLFNLHQRPVPKTGEDIGTWQTIFLVISIISVVTNAALTSFTMDVLNSSSMTFRFWIFVSFQWVCFALQAFIMAIIPDVPEDIEIQLQRTEFISRKLIDKVADDNNEDVIGKNEEEIVFEQYPLDVGGEYAVHRHMFTEDMK